MSDALAQVLAAVLAAIVPLAVKFINDWYDRWKRQRQAGPVAVPAPAENGPGAGGT